MCGATIPAEPAARARAARRPARRGGRPRRRLRDAPVRRPARQRRARASTSTRSTARPRRARSSARCAAWRRGATPCPPSTLGGHITLRATGGADVKGSESRAGSGRRATRSRDAGGSGVEERKAAGQPAGGEVRHGDQLPAVQARRRRDARHGPLRPEVVLAARSRATRRLLDEITPRICGCPAIRRRTSRRVERDRCRRSGRTRTWTSTRTASSR